MIHIREAAVEESALLAHHRVGMFRDMGQLGADQQEDLEREAAQALSDMLQAGVYRGWVACEGTDVVGGGGLLLRAMLPSPRLPCGGREAHILNVYVEPADRRRGVARQLMQAMLAWCEANSIAQVTLHASDMGRPLYESLGFRPTNHMRWDPAQARLSDNRILEV